jgi:hypothetical protein
LREQQYARQDAEHGHEGPDPEVIVLDGVAAEHQHGHVGRDEHEEQQQDDGLGERGEVSHQGQHHGDHRGRDDRHPWRSTLRQNTIQHAREQAVLGHPVRQAARHDHGQQRAVGDGDQCNGTEQPVGHVDARGAHHGEQRAG